MLAVRAQEVADYPLGSGTQGERPYITNQSVEPSRQSCDHASRKSRMDLDKCEYRYLVDMHP